MLQNIFRNMQPVVKNLLIINVIFFLATFIFEVQNISLINLLGLHYIDSPLFEPYQLVTHFFMHSGLMHILFNMLGVVVLGNMLERVWGPKKFLIFYLITAFGAAILQQLIQGIEIYNSTGTWMPVMDGVFEMSGSKVYYPRAMGDLSSTWRSINTPMVGASGAVFGLLTAAAMLFPNQVVYLYFAIAVKMKWLALGAAVFALFYGFQNNPGDSVAHFAHLGGMLFGFITIKIWQRQRTDFY